MDPIKKPDRFSWARLLVSFGIALILVTTIFFGNALAWGQRVEAITSRLLGLEVITSIVLVSISFCISARWRHKLVWILVSIIPSLIWQPVGFPLILFAPFDKFSLIPASVTLAMTILFWLLEILEAKYSGIAGENPEDGMITFKT